MCDLVGSTVVEMGRKVQQWLLEVSPLRGQTMGRKAEMTLFPLPTSNSSLLNCFPNLSTFEAAWLSSVCISLNSLWGGELLCEGKVSEAAKVCLGCFVEDVQRVGQLSGTLDLLDWDQFLSSTSGVIRETRGLPGAILLPLCHGIMVPVEAWPEVCQGPADAGARRRGLCIPASRKNLPGGSF